MSVQIIDSKVFSAIGAKILDASYRKEVNINYIQCCFSFKRPLTEMKILVFINRLRILNDRSYCAKYKEPEDLLMPVKIGTCSMEPNTFQFLKWLHAINYNIEISTIEYSGRKISMLDKVCMKFLKRLIHDTENAIIDSLPEYKVCKWSEY